MRKILNTYGFFCLGFLLLILLSGCASDREDQAAQQEDEQEYVLVTEPDGVIMTVNGMPITRGEMDEYLERFVPEDSFGILRAFYSQYLPQTIIEKTYEKELNELKKELEEILAKVNAGEMTFEKAVMDYSDDPAKEQNKGLMEAYGPGGAFYNLDKTVLSLDKGQISEPFFTPIGCMAVKVEDVQMDSKGEFVSVDLRQLMLTLDRYLPEDEEIFVKSQELMYESEVEILDKSFAKEFPELYAFGFPPDEQEAAIEEAKNFDDPEKNWRDQPDDAVLARINGVDITVGQLNDDAKFMMPRARDIYNVIIRNLILPNLGMIGYFKEHHEDIFKRLNEIKAKIEAGEMTFEEAQMEYSDDPSKEDTPLFESIGKDDGMVPQFEKVMLGTVLNEISDPFLTMYGGHILLVEGEDINEKGERETVDVRHILIAFDQYVDQDDPNAMYQVRLKLQRELDIKVRDAYLHSLLPRLGLPPKEPEPAEPEAEKSDEPE